MLLIKHATMEKTAIRGRTGISTHSERRPKLVIKDHIIYPYSIENKLMHLHFTAISTTFTKIQAVINGEETQKL